MKLSHVHIKEFQSVRDSNSFEIGDITCLVGKNEAGKTALLRALYRLNPINEGEGNFDVTDDYPRETVTDYEEEVKNGLREEAHVVEARFHLEKAETAPAQEEFGQGVLPKSEYRLTKGYTNELTYDFTIDERVAGETLLTKANLLRTLEGDESSWGTLPELEVLLNKTASKQQQKFSEAQETANGLTDPDAKTKALAEAQLLQESAASKSLRATLKGINKVGLSKYIDGKFFDANIPKFLYFDEYYQMRGCANIEALKQRIDSNNLEPSDHPLLGLVQLAGLSLDHLLNPARTRELKNKLEGAGNHLTARIMKYWSQNKHLRMNFDVRPARPQDPPGMRQGTNIWAEIYDSKHLVTTDAGTRSRGFVWFFSFLAWYSRQRKSSQPLILLLDEPGLSLHAKAQEDLLRYFEAELKPHHQLIYTTHSPFMVDPRHFDRIRIVQDKGIDTVEPLPPKEEGTKVFVDVLDASADSLFPLQGALGYEIYQTLFVGPNSLVVEGVSDLLYIQAISSLLAQSGRDGLDPRWTVTPVGGADKVPTFVALIGAQKGLNVATLIDLQKSHQQAIQNLYKKKLLKKKNVHTFADFTGKTESDIEDMFEPDLYLRLLNSEYSKQLSKPISAKDLNLSQPRVLVSLEEFFKSNSILGGARFDHYRPARYFSENLSKLSQELSEATLDRFEKAFKALNALLL